MKKITNISDVMDLSIAERIEFVEDLWDSIAEVPEKVELTEDQKRILNERLKAYHRNPNEGSPWEAIKDRIRNRQ